MKAWGFCFLFAFFFFFMFLISMSIEPWSTVYLPRPSSSSHRARQRLAVACSLGFGDVRAVLYIHTKRSGNSRFCARCRSPRRRLSLSHALFIFGSSNPSGVMGMYYNLRPSIGSTTCLCTLRAWSVRSQNEPSSPSLKSARRVRGPVVRWAGLGWV